MKRRLNVSVIQMPIMEPDESLEYLEKAVSVLMQNYVKPELVVGAEFGISARPDTVPGEFTRRMGAIARKYGIYFLPCTMAEISPELPQGKFYNTCVVYGPNGEIVAKYRKQVPFRPAECSEPAPQKEFCVFRIPEKDVTVGLMICYDQFCPEIPRTLALMGAELILCPALDPQEFSYIPDLIPRVRALENECYFVWSCSTGIGPKTTYCGRSVIAGPEGEIVHQCGENPALVTKTLDFDRVREKRLCGMDQHLNSLRRFGVEYPFAGRISEAPVYRDMPPVTETHGEYAKRLEELGIGSFGKSDSKGW